MTYRRFDSAADAIAFAIEELDPASLNFATLAVDEVRFDRHAIRQLYEAISGSRGHMTLRGSVKTVADTLEDWFATGAADGFNVLFPTLPGALDDFIALVTPELQRRGLFRTDYEGTTLREHLGLAPTPDLTPQPSGLR